MIRLFLLLFGASILFAQSEVSSRILVSSEANQFRRPSAIAIGVSGLIYVADTGNNRLVALDSLGSVVLESSKGGSSGELRWPVDVTVGAGGRVYVCDSGNRRVVEFTRLLEWKGELRVLSSANNVLEPKLITANPVGDLFVYESDGNQLLRYDSFYNVIARLGGQSGRAISMPYAMTYSPSFGLLWISRQDNSIFQSDEFLSDPHSYRMFASNQAYSDVSAIDSTLFAIGTSYVYRHRSLQTDSLSIQEVLSDNTRPADLRIEAAAGDRLYILDTKRGSLQVLHWP